MWFSGSYSPVRNAQGEVIRIVKFSRVVSEEKEKNLLVKGQMNAISHALPAFFLTPDQNLLSPNAVFTEVSGFKRPELRKLQFSDFLADYSYRSQQWESDLRRMFVAGELLDLSLEMRFADGQVQSFRAIFSPIRMLSGHIEKAFVILIPKVSVEERPFVGIESISEQ